jgi:hypothetical protein
MRRPPRHPDLSVVVSLRKINKFSLKAEALGEPIEPYEC